jgi:hypothetical protein
MLHKLRRELLLGAVGFGLGAAPLLLAHSADATRPQPAPSTTVLAAALVPASTKA